MQGVSKFKEAHTTKTVETFRKTKKSTAQMSCVHITCIEFANEASDGREEAAQKQSYCTSHGLFFLLPSQAVSSDPGSR